jgi:hypothetical protein
VVNNDTEFSARGVVSDHFSGFSGMIKQVDLGLHPLACIVPMAVAKRLSNRRNWRF